MDALINIIVGAIVLLIIGGAVFYLVRAKKRGQKCVGCPYSKQCGGACGCKDEKKPKEKKTSEK